MEKSPMQSTQQPLEGSCDIYFPTLQRMALGKSKRKPCCVCKMSKRLRDNCIRNNDEDVCIDFIKAHKLCLQAKGFRID